MFCLPISVRSELPVKVASRATGANWCDPFCSVTHSLLAASLFCSDQRSERERPLGSARGIIGRRPNGFLGLSMNDRTILFIVILLAKTLSVG